MHLSRCSLSLGLGWPAVRNYDVAPGGERFLFVKSVAGSPNVQGGSTPSRIIVVQNWSEELKRLVPMN